MGFYLKQTLKEIRFGLFESLLIGAKYGALVGCFVNIIIWSIFRSGNGLMLGLLLGLFYGCFAGAIIGAMVGVVLSVNKVTPPDTYPAWKVARPGYIVGSILGALGGILFSTQINGAVLGAVLGLIVAYFVIKNQIPEPKTFAQRVMYDPDLLTGPVVWGIFAATVGAIVAHSVNPGWGMLNGLLLGALVGLAIAHSRRRRQSNLTGGPTIRRP